MSTLGLSATGAALDAVDRHVPTLVEERFASRLAAEDPTLWGPAAEEESAKRLGWIDAVSRSRPLLPRIAELAEALRSEGVDRVVLAGMGGSSLAPEVIAGTAGRPLTVLDSTDPDQVRAALTDLERTVLVVSSKSGSTVETDSQRRIVAEAFTAAGIDAASRIVVVTDPGSPLEQAATEAGYRAVFTADPTVGGRYSALTAFGLVPTGLAGVDVESLLDDAESVLDLVTEDDADNPALQLGAALGGTQPLRDKLIVSDVGSGIAGFGDWAEQLIAESTGKEGVGLLPVVVAEGAPEATWDAADLLQVVLTGDQDSVAAPAHGVVVSGSLGALLLVFEVATAVAGRLLGINPFDQPDVEAAKAAARELLDAPAETAERGDEVEGVLVSGVPAGAAAGSLAEVLRATLDLLPEDGYLTVQAYLDRHADAALERLRPVLAEAAGRPVTFGWGPRFLHSTGQLHKGGGANAVVLQLTGEAAEDLDVPDRPFTLGRLIAAQASGDAGVLAEHGLPVVRLHLTDRAAGIAALRSAADAL
ncbi:glucose-6-phosphate isomerase [Micrococcus luteus]